MKSANRTPSVANVVIVIAAVVIIIAGMSAAKSIIVPFLLAAFISIISSPPLFWLEKKGAPPWLALLIVLFVILSFLLLVAGLVGSSVNDFSNNIPTYEVKLKEQVTIFLDWLKQAGIDVSRLELNKLFDSTAIMKLITSLINAMGGVLTNGFLILLSVIFMLLEAASIPTKLHTIFRDPEKSLGYLNQFINTVNRYMIIKTAISFTTGAFVAMFLTIMGVDYPLVWGLLAFALNYVPNIGSIMAAVPAILLTLVKLGAGRALGVTIGYIVIGMVMGNIIEPRVMGRGVGLSTLVVFVSLIFWGWILGPVGMVLSVPLTMTVKIALYTSEDTRWIAILLGSDETPETQAKITKRRGR